MTGNRRTSHLGLRRAVPADAAALAEFAARTFAEAFGAQNRPEDVAAHLASAYGVAQQLRELSDPTYRTLLLEDGPRVAAFAQLRRHPAPGCVRSPEPVELHRFYVDRPWQGRGVAALLMSAVEEAAAELGGRTLWLSVWERNPRAIRFYAKCGFRDVGTADFYVGPDRQTDRILERAIGPELSGMGPNSRG